MNNGNGPRADVQFSVFLQNKPGTLARVLQRLAEEKINIVAMTMMDTTEHGVLRIVPENPAATRDVLKSLDAHMTETQVLTAAMPNQPGALAHMCERLAADRINIQYAYCTTAGGGSRTLGIFKVSDMPRAISALTVVKPRRKAETAVRSNGRGRRK